MAPAVTMVLAVMMVLAGDDGSGGEPMGPAVMMVPPAVTHGSGGDDGPTGGDPWVRR